MSQPSTIHCPTPEALLSFLNESNVESEQVEMHVQECDLCQEFLRTACDDPTIEKWRELDLHRLPQEVNSRSKTTLGADLRREDTDLDSLNAANTPRTPSTPEIPGFDDLQKIGCGGMGVVYQARDRRLRRQVALKILTSVDSIQPDRWLRFQIEAEAAARLQHPNVIRVYGAGSHSGVAYVCQELADTRSLADQIDQTPQSPRYCAELIKQLAVAIQHAHDHGVLHRDLKPANVLFVGDTPKIADFGIAKLIDRSDQLTQTSAAIGTPHYMSPEQAAGDSGRLGFPTDVYGLGVILYEMLTGIRPFRGETSHEVIQQVLLVDPLPTRKLNPSVPRDLDTICLKCLQKDPAHRYQSGGELSEDLGRYLVGQPILAKPAGAVQHAWKWMLRHPAWSSVAGVSLVAIISLVILWAKFTHALSVQTEIAEDRATEARERLVAQIESNQATNEVVRFLTRDLFDAAIPENEGIGLTVLDVLDSAGENIDRRFRDHPRVEAALRAAIGNTYFETGHRQEALDHLEKAVDTYNRLGDQADFTLMSEAKLALALCLKSLGHNERSRRILDQLLDPDNPTSEFQLEVRFATLNTHERSERRMPDDSQLLQLYKDCREYLGVDHTTTLSVLGSIGVAHFHAEQYEQAVEIFERQRQQLMEAAGSLHPDTVIANNNLAVSYIRMNRLDDAERVHRKNCELKRECLGEDHFMTLNSYHNLAMVIWRQGRHDEATEILEEVIRDRMRTLGAANPSTLDSLFQIGRMYQGMNQPESGAAVFHDVIEPVWEQRVTNHRWLDLAQVYGPMLFKSGDQEKGAELRDIARNMLNVDGLANKYRTKVQQEFEALFDLE